jgi:hypothetical protein
MASDIGLPRRTLSRYLDLLELIFVIKRIPAWSSNLTTRAPGTSEVCATWPTASAIASGSASCSTRESSSFLSAIA